MRTIWGDVTPDSVPPIVAEPLPTLDRAALERLARVSPPPADFWRDDQPPCWPLDLAVIDLDTA